MRRERRSEAVRINQRLAFVQIRRRRWLIRAQGWSEATTLGLRFYLCIQTLKGFVIWRTLSGLIVNLYDCPQGWSEATTLGLRFYLCIQTLKGFVIWRTLSGLIVNLYDCPQGW